MHSLATIGILKMHSNGTEKIDMTIYHHMNLSITSSCQVSELGEKVKLHGEYDLLHVGCYTNGST